MEKINRLNVGDHLLEYQFQLIGKTLDDAKNEPEWHNEWTISSEQFVKLQTYAIPLLKKVLKCNRAKSVYSFSWFMEQFGLKIV